MGGYEAVNDAERLSQDRTFRLIQAPSRTPTLHPKLGETPQDPSTDRIGGAGRDIRGVGRPASPTSPASATYVRQFVNSRRFSPWSPPALRHPTADNGR
jgi:hypothetical protein